MQFTYKGNKVRLIGINSTKLQNIQSQKLDKLVQASGELSMLQLIPCEVGNSPQVSSLTMDNRNKDPALKLLLQEFDTVFQEPQGL